MRNKGQRKRDCLLSRKETEKFKVKSDSPTNGVQGLQYETDRKCPPMSALHTTDEIPGNRSYLLYNAR